MRVNRKTCQKGLEPPKFVLQTNKRPVTLNPGSVTKVTQSKVSCFFCLITFLIFTDIRLSLHHRAEDFYGDSIF